MVYNYGMNKMNTRATFALDDATIQRLKKLALLWHVSQAEVVRKAIKMAEYTTEQQKQEKLQYLYRYHKKNGLSAEIADAYLQAVKKDRSEWGREK